MIGAKKKDEKIGSRSPNVDSFKINGKATRPLREIATMLSSISFLEVALESSAINSAYVESRDINNRPYLFSLMKIEEESISVIYSIPSNIAPKKRRIDIIRQLLNVLNVIEDGYEVDNRTIYNLIDKAIKEVGELVDKKTAAIYVEYDTIKNQNLILSKKVRILESEVEELKNKYYEMREEKKEMSTKIKDYENPSDETLKIKVQEWIKDHDGKINISDFASVYLGSNKFGERRVEKILNELVIDGYLSNR